MGSNKCFYNSRGDVQISPQVVITTTRNNNINGTVDIF